MLHQHLAKTCVNVLINLQELHIVTQRIENYNKKNNVLTNFSIINYLI